MDRLSFPDVDFRAWLIGLGEILALVAIGVILYFLRFTLGLPGLLFLAVTLALSSIALTARARRLASAQNDGFRKYLSNSAISLSLLTMLVAVILITTGGPYSEASDQFTSFSAIQPASEDGLYFGPARILLMLVVISALVVFASTLRSSGQRKGLLLFAGAFALPALIISIDITIPTRLAGLARLSDVAITQIAPLPGMFPGIEFGIGALPISIISLLVLMPFYLLNKSLETSRVSDEDSEVPPASLYIVWQRRLGPFVVITLSTLFAFLVHVLGPSIGLRLDTPTASVFSADIARLYFVGLIGFSLPLLVLVRHDQRTRERMSTEIRESIVQAAHDKVSNRLSALALRAEAASQHHEEALEVLATMPDALRQAVADLKLAVGGEPAAKGQVSTAELSSRASGACNRASREFGTDISCGVAVQEHMVFDGQTAEAVLQCLEEALANVARHAQATSVKVSVFCDRSVCHLVIDDNGVGFVAPDDLEALTDQGHLGLIGISKRAELLKEGQLTIDSSPGRGSRIEISWRT